MSSRLLRGALAGIAGTAALSLLTGVEARLRGRAAVYEPARMSGRLARRFLGIDLLPQERRLAGTLMRWPYGALWGVTLSLLQPRSRWLTSGLGLGAMIWLFELVALPLTRATPPLRKWDAKEVGLDGVNSCVYGAVTAAVLKRLAAGRQ